MRGGPQVSARRLRGPRRERVSAGAPDPPGPAPAPARPARRPEAACQLAFTEHFLGAGPGVAYVLGQWLPAFLDL